MTFYAAVAGVETCGTNVKPGGCILLTFIHIHYQKSIEKSKSYYERLDSKLEMNRSEASIKI